MEADPAKRRCHHTLKFVVITLSLLVVGVNCNGESSIKHTTMPTAFVEKRHVRREPSKRDRRQINEDFETPSVYTRWGRPGCPEATTEIYAGYIGGPSDGGGSDLQCLPSNLPSGNGAFVHPPAKVGFTGIAPAKFHSISEPLQLGVIHCAVCLSPSISNIMVPGWKSCPSNWKREYEGRLMGASKQDGRSSSYICMDKTPTVSSGIVFTKSISLSYVKNKGCPGNNVLCRKYSAKTEIPCVVCTFLGF